MSPCAARLAWSVCGLTLALIACALALAVLNGADVEAVSFPLAMSRTAVATGRRCLHPSDSRAVQSPEA